MSNTEQAKEVLAELANRAAELQADIGELKRIMEDRDQEVPDNAIAALRCMGCVVDKMMAARLELETMRVIQEAM